MLPASCSSTRSTASAGEGRGRITMTTGTPSSTRRSNWLDGAVRSSGIVIVGATNHPEAIDAALLRSGRLETHIRIPPPDIDALAGILRHHLRK